MTDASTTAAPRTFLDRQRDAAMDAMRAEGTLRKQISTDLRLDDDHRRGLGDVITLSPGAYAVEVIEYRVTDPDATPTWTTVYNGKPARQYFGGQHGRQMALLHLIATTHGSDDSHGTAAFYAARVLGVPTES